MSQAIILEKKQILDDTFIIHISPFDKKSSFLPGQYVFLENPLYKKGEYHPFSIASSPLEKKYVELCIKTYGDWTKTFCSLEEGSKIYISEPQGNFIWNEEVKHVVFLLGGIGISPIMSILRYLTKANQKPSSITMLYGNRTPDTIAYKDKLIELSKKLPIKIIDIFSEIDNGHSWNGYKGFITEDIIKNEANLHNNPSFYIVGPPIFVDKMEIALNNLVVNQNKVKKELLEQISLDDKAIVYSE